MLFSTPEFLFAFLPLALALHFVGGRALRDVLLLLVSLSFYAWGEGAMVLVMLLSVGLNWLIAQGIHARRGAERSGGDRALLWLAIVVNLGLLALFKYGRWALGETSLVVFAEGLGKGGGPPIGISFFTFQALSYVVDVYRGERPQRNPLRFGLYIALFPQLIAGPIVRYKDIAAQLVDRRVSVDGFAEGARRFVTGLGKKVVIADTLSVVVGPIFDLPTESLGTATAWVGLLAYSLQIYFDFSGYSDMAIGLGAMFGFRFRENFDHPYVARSMTEFWRRWHISLSTWFRDYLYIPLGGSRRGPWVTYRNLVVVFLLCGLWHGASLNFVLWGAFHGAFLVFERAGGGTWLARLPRPLQHVYLLLAVAMGWVLFRGTELVAAAGYYEALWSYRPSTAWPPARFVEPVAWLALALGVLGSMPWMRWGRQRLLDSGRPGMTAGLEVVTSVGVVAVLLLSVVLLSGAASTPFIYLRF